MRWIIRKSLLSQEEEEVGKEEDQEGCCIPSQSSTRTLVDRIIINVIDEIEKRRCT